MARGPTKKWLTPERIARGIEAAEAELKRWHMSPEEARRYWRSVAGDFKPAIVEGKREADIEQRARVAESLVGKEVLTAADVARARREAETGAAFMKKDPLYEPLLTPRFIILSAIAVGGGYLVGRWLKRRSSAPARAVAGDAEISPHLRALALCNL